MHRDFFGKLFKNPENAQTFCIDSRNLLHFACQKWINQLN